MAHAKQRVSFPLGGKVLLFDDLRSGCSLFLYERGVEVHGALISFVENGLKNGVSCLFAYDNTEGKLHPEQVFHEQIEAGKLHLLPMGKKSVRDEVKELSGKFGELHRRIKPDKGESLRAVVDFGSLPTRSSIGDIIGCVGKIIQKKIRAINAFNVESLPGDAVKELMELHDSVVISARNEYAMSMLNFRGGELPEAPSVETLPRDALERFVKRHLETLVLSMLRQNQMCGYDVIRTIYQRYHTFLSQGTVYPLLYSLEGKGLLEVVKSDSPRSKVYALTEEGKRVADSKINDFVSAQKYLLESIER
jgi:DNA-binding PadR family transcriptional regulator